MDDHYVTVALPQLPDGRSFISDQMLAEYPDLRDVLSMGHNYWAYSPLMSIWLSPLETIARLADDERIGGIARAALAELEDKE